MTEIILHGILAKKFGANHKFANIKKPMDVINAINVNREGFRNFIMQSAQEGSYFEFIIDDEKPQYPEELVNKRSFKKIEIVPSLKGKDEFLKNAGQSPTFKNFGSTLFLNSMVAYFGVKDLAQPTQTWGGAAGLEIAGRSFNVHNQANVTTQGANVPVGYGLLRIGSRVAALRTLFTDASSQVAGGVDGIGSIGAGGGY